MARTVPLYPEWVNKFRVTGTVVRKIGENYYLYKHSSKRVPGRKNPVPKDEYIGRITPDGVVASNRRRVDTSRIIVREYGFSNAVIQACPESWKVIQGCQYYERLLAIIKCRSGNTYLLDEGEPIRTASELQFQISTSTSSLNRRFSERYGLTLDDLQRLDTIFLVSMSGKSYISDISEEQQRILDKLEIQLVAK